MVFPTLQAEVPVGSGRASGARRDAQVLQAGAPRLRSAALLQRVPLQAILRHSRILLPGETLAPFYADRQSQLTSPFHLLFPVSEHAGRRHIWTLGGPGAGVPAHHHGLNVLLPAVVHLREAACGSHIPG